MLTPHEQKVEALRTALPQLAERDQSFAKSLIESYDDHARLSDKQFVWIEKLLDRVTPQSVEETKAKEAEKAALKPIVDLLVTASEKHKKPAIRFVFSDGTHGKLSLAPSYGVNAGHVYIKDGSQYAGKITPSGELRLVGPNTDRKAELIEVLTNVAKDPIAAAKAFAKATKTADRKHGSCCFCGIELTDERSVIAGYGPICAAKYNLPWGDASASEESEKTAGSPTT